MLADNFTIYIAIKLVQYSEDTQIGWQSARKRFKKSEIKILDFN